MCGGRRRNGGGRSQLQNGTIRWVDVLWINIHIRAGTALVSLSQMLLWPPIFFSKNPKFPISLPFLSLFRFVQRPALVSDPKGPFPGRHSCRPGMGPAKHCPLRGPSGPRDGDGQGRGGPAGVPVGIGARHTGSAWSTCSNLGSLFVRSVQASNPRLGIRPRAWTAPNG